MTFYVLDAPELGQSDAETMCLDADTTRMGLRQGAPHAVPRLGASGFFPLCSSGSKRVTCWQVPGDDSISGTAFLYARERLT